MPFESMSNSFSTKSKKVSGPEKEEKTKFESIKKEDLLLPAIKHYHNYKGNQTTKSSNVSPLVLRKQLGDFRKDEFKNDYIARYIAFI